ncbi:hypothetical protein HID58_013810 [Brassica napus]|uniref:Uncharacterized protein n=1 Tax=Brassica napus TaxID=3708 RepID=A0ABQ8DFY3_BRANA|nr:hypothetical protein HID58_013810 [Brassica napus]
METASVFQFRALSDQLYRSSEYHKQVRGEVVKQVRCLMIPVSVLGAHIPFRTSFPSYSVVFVLLLQLKDNRTIYESYVLMKYKRYYKRMAKLGEWETILPYKLRQIGLLHFAAKICLLTSFRDTCFIEILPQDQAPKRAYGKCTLTKLWLYMFGIVHYNSLYDNQGLSFCLQSRFQFSRSQRENIGCSRKQASHIDNIFEFYSFSIVHKSTVSDADNQLKLKWRCLEDRSQQLMTEKIGPRRGWTAR